MDDRSLRRDLARFTTATAEHRHRNHEFSYTAGVAHLVDAAGAAWLLDYIAGAQKRARKNEALRTLQVWTLTMTARHRAELRCETGDGEPVIVMPVPILGGFPLHTVTLCLNACELLRLESERST